MSISRPEIETHIRVAASEQLIVALDVLLQKAGTALTLDQRIEVLSVIIATGGALRRNRRGGGDADFDVAAAVR
jgi:hypothetical protein